MNKAVITILVFVCYFSFSIRAYSYYDRNVIVTLGPGFNFTAAATTGFHVRAEGTLPEMEMYTRTLGVSFPQLVQNGLDQLKLINHHSLL
jgi:hypothetical protein